MNVLARVISRKIHRNIQHQASHHMPRGLRDWHNLCIHYKEQTRAWVNILATKIFIDLFAQFYKFVKPKQL